MRLPVVALLLGLSAPAWGAAASLSAQDEARLIYLEKRVGELDAQNRELRAFAEKTAKGEADGVKDIAAAQVQALNSTLANWLTAVGVITALLAAAGFFNMAKIKAEAMALAQKTSQDEANAYLDRLNAGLTAKVGELEKRLKDQEDQALKDMQERLNRGRASIDEHVKHAKRMADEAEEASRMLQGLLSGGRGKVEGEEAEEVPSATPSPSPGAPPEEMSLPKLVRAAWDDHRAGRIEEATAKALSLAERMPDDPSVLILLSRCHQEAGRAEEAVAAARRAVKAAKRGKDRRLEGVAHGDLGDALQRVGQVGEAKAAFACYRDIFASLAAGQPDNDLWQRSLGIAWGRLGDVALEEGNREEAKAAFVLCRDIFGALTAKDANNDELRWHLGGVLGRLGEVALNVGNLDEANEAFDQSRDIATALTAKDAGNDHWRRSFGSTLRQSARVALVAGEVDAAEAWLRQAEEIVDALRAKDAEKPLYRQDKAWLTGLWGDWHAAKGEADDARRCWGEAVTGLESLDQAKTLDFVGRRTLKEYRAKLAA